MKMIDAKKVFIKRAGIAQKLIDGNTVIYDELEGEILAFNEVGSCIWGAISKDNTLSDIIRIISSDFSTKESIAEKDVVSFIRRLLRLELIEEYTSQLKREKLYDVYGQIPQTTCPGCARCCSNVIIHSLEFENIKMYIEDNFSAELIEEIRAKIALNIATQIKQRQFMRRENIEEMLPLEICAFLGEKENKCLIYHHRPFACRVFGIEKKSECRSQGIRFKSGLPMPDQWPHADALRKRLELLSDYYHLPGLMESFNKAEINSWFYYGNQLVLSDRQG
jgi:Fe-S-cluster containining protein